MPRATKKSAPQPDVDTPAKSRSSAPAKGRASAPAKSRSSARAKSTETAPKATARKRSEAPARRAGNKGAETGSSDAPRRTRSAATREEIIQATITCFVQIGYARTTTTEIAKVAGYTRGAVQHYFPTTEHVLKASVNYLTKSWLDSYMAAAREAPPGVDFIDYAVDTLWRFVNDRLFVAWQELVSASRTDKTLRRIILPAAAKFERLRRDMAGNNFPDFAHVGRDKFDRNRDTLRFVLEGITSTILTYEREDRIAAQLDWLKEWFHSSWQHELSTNQVDRRGSV